MRKFLTVGFVAGALALTLSGCGAQTTQNVEETSDYVDFSIEEIHHTLKDGRVVTCLIEDGFRVGGISCDWESASLPSDK